MLEEDSDSDVNVSDVSAYSEEILRHGEPECIGSEAEGRRSCHLISRIGFMKYELIY